MRPQKPDRWERIVANQYSNWWCKEVGDTAKWHNADVVKLLRREHAWVRRMVQRIAQDYESSVGDTAAETLCDDILVKLKERAK